MKPKKFQLRKTLSVIDGFFILLLTFLLVNSLAGSGLFPTEFLASILPGGANRHQPDALAANFTVCSDDRADLVVFILAGKNLGTDWTPSLFQKEIGFGKP